MEGWFYIFGFWGGIWLLSVIFDGIKKMKEAKRSRKRDEIAEEVLKNINIDIVLKNINSKVEYIKKNYSNNSQDKYRQKMFFSNLQSAGKFSKCPTCEEGYLNVRTGKYGKFYGCSNYPNCHYTGNITNIDKKFKVAIGDSFTQDFKDAYY